MAPDTEIEFQKWIDQNVAEATQSQVIDFSVLVERLPGVYPAEVLASLQRLSTSEASINGTAQALVHSARVPNQVSSISGSPRKLLPPHPLDYEWRFSPTAVDALVETCNACTLPGAPIALVATPTIAVSSEARFGDRNVTYFGADTDALCADGPPGWLAALINMDLLKRPSNSVGLHATVVMDPPWYEEYVQRFLWFAGLITRVGGTLLLAMPPDGTRPGVADENSRYLAWCKELGFSHEAIALARLPYEMPPFERNALRAMDILNIHSMWRKANLWQLRKVRPTLPPWPGDVAHSAWSEHRFGRVRIRINHEAPSQGEDPRLRTLVANDILPTVSRRYERRSEARVWTTGNRIFACDAPGILSALLTDWRNEQDTVKLSRELKQETQEQIGAIVEKETRELF